MVILVVCKVVEHHATIHFLYVLGILSYVACQCKQVAVVKHWLGKGKA